MQSKREVCCSLDRNLHRTEVCRILCGVAQRACHLEEGKNVVGESEQGGIDAGAAKKMGNEED